MAVNPVAVPPVVATLIGMDTAALLNGLFVPISVGVPTESKSGTSGIFTEGRLIWPF